MERGIFERHSSGQKRKRTGSCSGENESEHGRGAIVISVVESRGREVCICKMDTSKTTLMEVYLHLDGHSYNETLLEICMLQPDEILLHDGAREKTLSKKITKQYHRNTRIINISRQYFDQDRGADMLRRVVAGKLDQEKVARYTVLAGAFCLLKYIENCRNTTFISKSVRVNFEKGNTGRMLIDRKTAFHLELVMNARTGDQRDSLFGVVNHTNTPVGARLLRSNILSPLADVSSILHRQILVEYLLRNPEVYNGMVTILNQFPDLDKMLHGLTYRPKVLTINTARVGIDSLLYIKHALQSSEQIAQLVLHRSSDIAGVQEEVLIDANLLPDILQQAVANFRDSRCYRVQQLIGELLLDGAMFSKSHQEMRFQECFAVASGIDGFLDAARKLYLQSVEDIYEAAKRLEQSLGITIKVTYTSRRGYHLMIPSELLPLPSVFVQPVQSRSSIHCSTLEIISLSDRAMEAMDQCIILTNQLISAHLECITEDIDVLFRLTDSIALLDMCLCFADVVALSSSSYVCPDITKQGSIVLNGARHPILIAQNNRHGLSSMRADTPNTSNMNQSHGTTSVVPNDVWLDDIERFSIITGPNGSGKTIYMKQVALIVILAQIGCFVPCRSARINIRSSILSRVGTSDDLENNMSTFATEMNDAAYVLDHASRDSLVLVDELGRGTCILDGVSIAIAISEALIASQAFVLFVTHFPQLTELPNMYPFARNLHLKTNLLLLNSDTASEANHNPQNSHAIINQRSNNRDSGGAPRVGIEFLHQVDPGASDMNNGYGILMSEICDFPASIVQDARKFRQQLGDLYPFHCDSSYLQQQPQFVLFKLLQKLRCIVDSMPIRSEFLSDDETNISQEARDKLKRVLQRISVEETQVIESLLDQVSLHLAGESLSDG